MNTLAIIELKRHGWRQNVAKSSFMIFGKSPYADLIKPRRLWKKADNCSSIGEVLFTKEIRGIFFTYPVTTIA
jgi:hypothetical protein